MIDDDSTREIPKVSSLPEELENVPIWLQVITMVCLLICCSGTAVGGVLVVGHAVDLW